MGLAGVGGLAGFLRLSPLACRLRAIVADRIDLAHRENFRRLAFLNLKYVRCDTVDNSRVVAGAYDRAVVSRQCLDQPNTCGAVQVVCRLVEQKDVRRLNQEVNPGELRAGGVAGPNPNHVRDGEDDRVEYAKPPTILELFTGIKFNYHRLFLHYGYFDLWVIMYNQTMIIVPYIIMGPGLFTGAMTLGILIQTSSAFREVQGSFSLFIQNWTRITELRSIYRRLTEFEKAIGYKDPNKPLPVIERS